MDVIKNQYFNSINRILSSEIKVVDKTIYNDRLKVCKMCNFYEKYENDSDIFRCKKCGCAGFNIMIQDYKCPLKPSKWRK